jgi:hypothetical protein
VHVAIDQARDDAPIIQVNASESFMGCALPDPVLEPKAAAKAPKPRSKSRRSVKPTIWAAPW